jgi:hypothetical protein
LGEAVLFDFFDDEISVNGHDGIDLCATSFECVTSPDVADSGEIVGLRGIN